MNEDLCLSAAVRWDFKTSPGPEQGGAEKQFPIRRKIRVVLDKISPQDEKTVKEFKLPNICTKEIWCKRLNERGFENREIV